MKKADRPVVYQGTKGQEARTLLSSAEEERENMRLQALLELIHALEAIPEYTNDELRQHDRETKKKSPLDRAIANLHLLEEIWEQVPLLQKWLRENGGSNYQVILKKISTLDGDDFLKLGLHEGRETHSGLYHESWSEYTVKLSPQKLERFVSLGGHYSLIIKHLGDLSVQEIGKKLLKVLRFNPKKDSPRLEQLERLSERIFVWQNMTFQVVDPPDSEKKTVSR